MCGTWHMLCHSSDDSKDEVYCSIEPGLMVLTTCQTSDKVLQDLTALSFGGSTWKLSFDPEFTYIFVNTFLASVSSKQMNRLFQTSIISLYKF